MNKEEAFPELFPYLFFILDTEWLAVIDDSTMENIQKWFSTCWQGCLACFKKPDRAGSETRREAKPATVLENPGAVNAEPAFHSKRSLPPLPGGKAGVYYVAQYDYSARTEEDLSFNAGDTLEALDKSAGEWWLARALNGVSANKQGYIPANYVAPVESIDAEP